MAPKAIFKKTFIKIVLKICLARGSASNRYIASRLGVDEITIRRWRKEHPDFDRAIGDAKNMLREMADDALINHLTTRKRKTVIDGPDGRTVKVEDVLSTHNDILALSKSGVGDVVHGEHDERREILRKITNQNIAGELTALAAAKLLEAEGIPVPKTLLLEVQKHLGIGSPGDTGTHLDIKVTAELSPEQAAEAYKKIMG